jgi:hypothetical protein
VKRGKAGPRAARQTWQTMAGMRGVVGANLRIANESLSVDQPCGLPINAVTLMPRTTKVGQGNGEHFSIDVGHRRTVAAHLSHMRRDPDER